MHGELRPGKPQREGRPLPGAALGRHGAAATLGEQLAPAIGKALDLVMQWTQELGNMASDGRMLSWLAEIGKIGITAIGSIVKWTMNLYYTFEAVFKTMQRIVLTISENWQMQIAGAFVGIVDTVIGAINAVIAAANKIPGVDIGLVEKPQFVEDMRIWAESSFQNVKDNLKDLLSGKDWTDAMDKSEAIGAKIGDVTEKLNSAVENWRKNTVDAITERKEKEASAKLATGTLGTTPTTIEKEKTEKERIEKPDMPREERSREERLDFDRWTKLGLYNFGIPNATRSLDIERNNLLRQIAAKLGIKETRTVLA